MDKFKRGPRGPQPGSAATLWRKLISIGTLTDEQIYESVKRIFPKEKNHIMWYKWHVRNGCPSQRGRR
jgi:hypothetical protein